MRYIETKTILSKLRTADRWFGIAYNMNLYRGCQHGCIYCDTRSDCYGIGDIAQIAVKRNALELLPAELRARRKKRATIGTGSMNDPYMPVERELRLTRRALGMIADERFPVHVITKSSLAERDADILQEISATYAAVSFTVTCADDALSVRTEPGAPASSERFRAMAALAAKGIYTGVTMMPLLPLINDTRENVEAIVRRAKDAGASYILPMFGVTLRSGSREHFHATLDREFPGLKARYEACFATNASAPVTGSWTTRSGTCARNWGSKPGCGSTPPPCPNRGRCSEQPFRSRRAVLWENYPGRDIPSPYGRRRDAVTLYAPASGY